MGKRSLVEVAQRPIRDVARDSLGEARLALERLVKWGVKVPSESRLHQAIAILEDATETGVLVPKHRGDPLGLRSLELASDYSVLTKALPSVPLASVRRELRESLVGPLDPPSNSRGPVQLQSQFVVRTALVLGGLRPEHPTQSGAKGRSPDLLVLHDGEQLAVEVKRPQETKNVLRNLESGRDQLGAYRVRGGVILDVTDCARDLRREDIDKEVSEIADAIYKQVFVNGKGPRPGYEHVIVAGAFARAAWNSTDGDDAATVAVHTSSRIGVFAPAPGTTTDIQARWLRNGLQSGLSALTDALEGPTGDPK